MLHVWCGDVVCDVLKKVCSSHLPEEVQISTQYPLLCLSSLGCCLKTCLLLYLLPFSCCDTLLSCWQLLKVLSSTFSAASCVVRQAVSSRIGQTRMQTLLKNYRRKKKPTQPLCAHLKALCFFHFKFAKKLTPCLEPALSRMHCSPSCVLLLLCEGGWDFGSSSAMV